MVLQYRQCDERDAAEMASIYRRCFRSYPFPLFEPMYIAETIRTDATRYFCIETVPTRDDGEDGAVSSTGPSTSSSESCAAASSLQDVRSAGTKFCERPAGAKDEESVMMRGHGGRRMVALSSAELNHAAGTAEMTDFATLAPYRGQGLAQVLLGIVEDHLSRCCRQSQPKPLRDDPLQDDHHHVHPHGTGGNNHHTDCDHHDHRKGNCDNNGSTEASPSPLLLFQTCFTIARSEETGMNVVFAKRGYAFGGTLWNNTEIDGAKESMNIWFKRLSLGT